MVATQGPWISFHAPWTSRLRSGLAVYAQITRFLDAVAIDPRPDSAALDVWHAPDAALDQVVEAAVAAFGPGVAKRVASGLTAETSWEWRRERTTIPEAALLGFFGAHEALPAIGDRQRVRLMMNHWFELKRPSTGLPLFPSSALRSAVMVWLDSRHVNLSVRYDAPEFTPALQAIHGEVVAALGPKTPRHALQQIFPATGPGGRERKVRIG